MNPPAATARAAQASDAPVDTVIGLRDNRAETSSGVDPEPEPDDVIIGRMPPQGRTPGDDEAHGTERARSEMGVVGEKLGMHEGGIDGRSVVEWGMSGRPESSSAYEHGQQGCRACYDEPSLRWNSATTREFAVREKRWRLRANPGYWGSSAPEVLVLGFSKGPNQDRKIAAGAAFEEIPFAGMRGDLRKLLIASGLLNRDVDIDSLFVSTECRFGFASLIRCSVSIWGRNNEKKLDWIGTGGNVIGQTIAAEPSFVTTCLARHLKSGLPDSVKIVVLLGSAEKNVRNIMKALGGKPGNPTAGIRYAYQALGRTVVHLPHPAGGNRDSIKAFCDGASDKSRDAGTLECRRQVLPAVAAALA